MLAYLFLAKYETEQDKYKPSLTFIRNVESEVSGHLLERVFRMFSRSDNQFLLTTNCDRLTLLERFGSYPDCVHVCKREI